MGFSRQEYWSGLPCPSPGDLPHPGIECRSPSLQADSLLLNGVLSIKILNHCVVYLKLIWWLNCFAFKLQFAAAAKSLQLCPTLCNPTDCSPPGSPISGILQARTLEWVAISFSNAYESEKWKGSHSVVSDFSRPHGLQPTRLLCPWDFPGKSTGVGCHCLLRNCSIVKKNKLLNYWLTFLSQYLWLWSSK